MSQMIAEYVSRALTAVRDAQSALYDGVTECDPCYQSIDDALFDAIHFLEIAIEGPYDEDEDEGEDRRVPYMDDLCWNPEDD